MICSSMLSRLCAALCPHAFTELSIVSWTINYIPSIHFKPIDKVTNSKCTNRNTSRMASDDTGDHCRSKFAFWRNKKLVPHDNKDTAVFKKKKSVLIAKPLKVIAKNSAFWRRPVPLYQLI